MSKPDKIVSINTKENRSEAFDRIMVGVDLLANAVKQTLGPAGQNFLLEKQGGKITNDGITIAREIQAKDEISDLGLRIVREAAVNTNEDAGDGTTTATTLAQAILHECKKYMASGTQFAKLSNMKIREKLERECTEVLKKLEAQSVPVESLEQLIEVARVSVENEELAKLIGTAQWDLGARGVIIPEENTDPVCEVERINGIRIDNGLGTSMVMNDAEKQRLNVKNVATILTNHQVQTILPFAKVISHLVDKGEREIVIVARAFSQDAIREIMENHQRGILIYPMNAPYVNQREVMKDLEATLGGRYLHDEDATLDSLTFEDLGKAQKVYGYRYSAIFTGPESRREAVLARVALLKKELEGESSKYAKRALSERIAQMEGGFALLKIGSTSDTERKYLFDKAEDAVHAVRHALAEGTVRGGGLATKEIADSLPDDYLLKRPLCAPYEQIQENAGGGLEIEEWVRNAAKVERVALENACKIAGTLVTTGGAVCAEKIRPVDSLVDKITGNG